MAFPTEQLAWLWSQSSGSAESSGKCIFKVQRLQSWLSLWTVTGLTLGICSITYPGTHTAHGWGIQGAWLWMLSSHKPTERDTQDMSLTTTEPTLYSCFCSLFSFFISSFLCYPNIFCPSIQLLWSWCGTPLTIRWWGLPSEKSSRK